MLHLRRSSVLAAAALGLLVLPGCLARLQPKPDNRFIMVGERTYKGVGLEMMHTLAGRTIRDLRLSRETERNDENGSFIVVLVPTTDYSEMALDIRPAADKSTHVTVFAHERGDANGAEQILDDLGLQVEAEKDPLHVKKKAK